MNRYRYLVPIEDAVDSLEFGGKAAQIKSRNQPLTVSKGFVISHSQH